MAFVFDLLLPACLALAAGEAAPADPMAGLADAAERIPGLQVELKYSTPDNFMGADAYGDLERCLLQPEAVAMLARASAALRRMRPELRLRVYDCVRPVSVQRRMWQVVRGTPQQRYVANPNSRTGSIHNYGCAVDLTLAEKDGTPLDMGTAFDHFGREAQPRHEFSMHRKGKLSSKQWANRLLLRQVMVAAGFIPIASEWWHFNSAPNHVVRKKYEKVP